MSAENPTAAPPHTRPVTPADPLYSRPRTARRVVIIGPGATGGAIAAELHTADVPVVLVARGAEYDAIAAHGLAYHTPAGSQQIRLPVANGPAGVALEHDDLLLLATKCHDAEAALRDWAWQPVRLADGRWGTAARHLPLLTIQNGLITEQVAQRWFTTIYGATIGCPGGKERAGEIINFGAAARVLVWLGIVAGGSTAERTAVADLLRRSSLIRVQEVEDIAPWKAWKLGYNTVNGLEPVFSGSPAREVLRRELRAEALEVLHHAGVVAVDPYHDSSSELDLSLIAPHPVAGKQRQGNSTLQSFLRGAPLETDYLNGEVVLLGRQLGIPTPLNESVQELVALVAAGALPDAPLDETAVRALLARSERPGSRSLDD